ncbi:MAG: methyltransferase [Gemmatimonadota bacterium]|nr:methyltransferase [Gemmatimonadota bacterium]
MTGPHQPLGSSPAVGVVSLLREAWRLEPFTPPFTFSAFFSPEDTLLCVCAAEAAMRFLSTPSAAPGTVKESLRVAELTSGSGLVGFYLLRQHDGATLLGLDIDEEAARVGEHNARILRLAGRARFIQANLWSPETTQLLESEKPHLLVCNPPYIPEPPDTTLQMEAGAGPSGTAHLLRALELAGAVKPDALALSWCSLSDPAAIVRAAESYGYRLDRLFVTAIADGEYSGSVHSYLRDLPSAYLNEQSDTVRAVAPDQSASFGYLLLAGAFSAQHSNTVVGSDAPSAVETICRDFAGIGVRTLPSPVAPFPVHCFILTRWDELDLRIMLHGPIARAGTA